MVYNSYMRVVGCFLEYNNKVVLLLRRPHKPDGNTWGLPGGKVEAGESDIEALRRELYEETGYQAAASEITLLGEYDFISPRGDTIRYVSHNITLHSFHEITLEDTAHSEYTWITIEEADTMDDLIHGLHDLFRLVGYLR